MRSNQQLKDVGKRAGFTLIELLIVVTILGILAAVVIPQFQSSTDEAKEANILSNLASVRHAIQLYRVQHGDVYPTTAIVAQLTGTTDASGSTGTRYGPYIRRDFPMNPLKERNDIQVLNTMVDEPSGLQGWRYAQETGEIRLNSEGTGPSGVDYYDM